MAGDGARGCRAGAASRIVEMVRPGGARDATAALTNRLIWADDNLVALAALLDEKDPATGGSRYRGKIDLVYIDPPFMVGSDFTPTARSRSPSTTTLTTTSMSASASASPAALPPASSVRASIPTYRDTWHEGLDGFLTMLRQRLVLLRELLSPAGSLYVHLDWHAVHYVKVVLDEILGYESFQNEIIWRRSLPHGNADHKFGASHDSILRYSVSPRPYWKPQYLPHSAEYLRRFYRFKEPNGRVYRLISCINPNPSRPNLTFEWKGVTRVWKYTKERMQRMHDAGLLVYSRTGVPSYKGFLDEMDGVPMQERLDRRPRR